MNESAVRQVVILQLKHHPRRRVAQITIHAEETRYRGRRAVGHALDVTVGWADQRTFHFDDARGHSPVADGGCVGAEIGMSSEPSTKKMEPCVRCDVSAQFNGSAQNCCPGSSIGKTVLIVPADLISALIAPVAP